MPRRSVQNSPLRRLARAVPATLLLLVIAGACGPGAGEKPLPQRRGGINDFSGTLSPKAVAELSASLESYERETCHQIVVVVLPSLEGESIVSFSARVMEEWEIGHSHLENGLLVTLDLDRGSGRIDVGAGLEEIVRSGAAEKILERDMFPSFREGDLEGGLRRGLSAVMEEGRGISYPPELQPGVCRSDAP